MAIAEEPDRTGMSVEEFLARLGNRAYGVAFLALAVLTFIPAVPGFSGLIGLALAFIAVQLVGGRPEPWLPRFVRKRRLSIARMRGGLVRAVGVLRRVERLCRPRLIALASPTVERLTGFVMLYLAVVIALPIPFIGNIPPAIAIAVLAVAIIEHDGLLVLAGLLISVLAALVTGAAVVTVVSGISNSVSGV